jgi:serine/threonine protein kinase
VSDEASYEQIIGGRYALYGPIASGGMATVHFGRLLGTGGFTRTVAIKRLHADFLETPEIISTLLDEARLASRIRHPHVVATLDMVAADDEVFLVMEYVAGESFARLLTEATAKGIQVKPRIATAILCGVLYGLQAAHDATDEQGDPLGIVHRDVSPQNVLVGIDGLARLLDFGIAKGKGRLQTTRAGQLKGKVGYMAPEQILGEDPDRRSDVYAAAVVLWEALTGRRLFPSGQSAGENFNLIPKILEADIEPPSAVADGIPPELNGIVMRGLNRARDMRYPTAHDFAVALEDTVGVATHRQVGEWVSQLAAETLAQRAEMLKSLEAASGFADITTGKKLLNSAVKARQRKRLAKKRAYADEETTTNQRGLGFDRHEATKIADPQTEVDSVDSPGAGPTTEQEPNSNKLDDEETTVNRPGRRRRRKRKHPRVTPSDPNMKRTKISGGLGAKDGHEDAVEARRQESEKEDLRKTIPNRVKEDLAKTSQWDRDSKKSIEDSDSPASADEPVTTVYEPSKMILGPPQLPGDGAEDSGEIEQADTELASTLPSNYRPGKGLPKRADMARRSSRPAFRSEPPSSSSDELAVPINSNRGIVIAVVIAAVIAASLAAMKFLAQ